jgi:hypothetical protein
MFEQFERVVRCSNGHLYQTLWIPLMSFKSVRLGPRRLQRCPVGHHWAAARRVDESTLSPRELAEARAAHDVRIP